MDDELDLTTEAFFPEGEPFGLCLYSILTPIIGIFVIVLNSLVVYSSGLLIEMRQHPRSCYMFLGNLGLANLCTGITVLFGHFYPSRSDISCALQIGMIVSTSLVSVYSVLLVAIDRFLYILRGLQYQQYMFPRRVRILTAVSWILCIVVGLLPLVPSLRGRMNADQCWFILLTPEIVLITTLYGTIPILIVFILYGFILFQAIKKVNELKKAAQGVETENNLRFFRGSSADMLQASDDDDIKRCSMLTNIFCCWEKKSSSRIEEIRRKPPSRWKAIKVVLLTTGSFLFTWVPYFIASTMYVYCDHENMPEFCYQLKLTIVGPLALIGFMNSLLNPLIYCWWHNGFRTNAIRLISKRFGHYSCCQRCMEEEPPKDSARTTQLSNLRSSIIAANTQNNSE